MHSATFRRLPWVLALAAALSPTGAAAQTPDSTIHVGDRVFVVHAGRRVSGIVTELDDSLSVDTGRRIRTIPLEGGLLVTKRVAERPFGPAFNRGAVRGALWVGVPILIFLSIADHDDGFFGPAAIVGASAGFAFVGGMVGGLLGVASRFERIEVSLEPRPATAD